MSGRGSAFLLKLGSGDPLSYATVGGFKIASEVINGEGLEIDSLSTSWRELLSGGGARSVAISAKGIFTGSKGEAEVRRLALAGELADFEIAYERGDKLRAKFLITRLEYAGDVFGERNYLIALESSGEVAAL